MSVPHFLPTQRCETTGRDRHRAARAAAACAKDAAELADLLDMLGLSARDGKAAPPDPPPVDDAAPEPDHDRALGAELALSMLGAVRRGRRPGPTTTAAP